MSDDKEPAQRAYQVLWAIQVWDENPLAAARQALGMQRDPGSSATVFRIEDEASGDSVLIDADNGEVYDASTRKRAAP